LQLYVLAVILSAAKNPHLSLHLFLLPLVFKPQKGIVISTEAAHSLSLAAQREIRFSTVSISRPIILDEVFQKCAKKDHPITLTIKYPAHHK